MNNRDWKKIKCKAVIQNEPKYAYTKDKIDYYEFNVKFEHIHQVSKVIVSKKIMDIATKQAYVKKIYSDVLVWISGKYTIESNQEILLKANQLILLDDCDAAYNYSKISVEDMKKICELVDNESINIDCEIYVVYVKERYILRYPEKYYFFTSNLIMDLSTDSKTYLAEKGIFLLHKGDKLEVEVDLKEIKDTRYISSIEAKNVIICTDSDDNIKSKKTQDEYEIKRLISLVSDMSVVNKKNLVVNSLFNLNLKQKSDIIFSTLKTGEKFKFFIKSFINLFKR